MVERESVSSVLLFFDLFRSPEKGEEERKGRSEKEEREERPTYGQIASLNSANRDPARDVPLWRSSGTAPPPGSASTCTNYGSAPATSPPHPRTRNLRRSGTTPRSCTSGFPLSRPSLRLHSKLRHTLVRLDSWLRCFRFDVADTELQRCLASPLLDTSRDPTWVHFGTC